MPDRHKGRQQIEIAPMDAVPLLAAEALVRKAQELLSDAGLGGGVMLLLKEVIWLLESRTRPLNKPKAPDGTTNRIPY